MNGARRETIRELAERFQQTSNPREAETIAAQIFEQIRAKRRDERTSESSQRSDRSRVPSNA